MRSARDQFQRSCRDLFRGTILPCQFELMGVLPLHFPRNPRIYSSAAPRGKAGLGRRRPRAAGTGSLPREADDARERDELASCREWNA